MVIMASKIIRFHWVIIINLGTFKLTNSTIIIIIIEYYLNFLRVR